MGQSERLKNKIADLKYIIARDKDKVFRILRDLIPHFSEDEKNELVLLETRHEQNKHQGYMGLLSPAESNLEDNRITNALTNFLDKLIALIDGDRREGTLIDANQPIPQGGKVQYRIPDMTIVGKEVKCYVYIMRGEKTLPAEQGDDIEDLPKISKTMTVELIDDEAEPAFNIRTSSTKEQIIKEEGSYTQWIFDVKPLREGEFDLKVKVCERQERGGRIYNVDHNFFEGVQTRRVKVISSSSRKKTMLQYLVLALTVVPFLWLGRGCDADISPPPPPMEAIAGPVKKIVPPPPPMPACRCAGLDERLFIFPTTTPPKVLTRLGTNPQFGYVRHLRKGDFLELLKDRYKASTRDRQFLNNICKPLGFSNGLSDVMSENLASVRLASGTIGNIGAGKSHRIVYAKLDVTGRDVEAFRLTGPNACSIHFMKTCGNVFYYCD